MNRISFATFLFTAYDKGDYSTDDVLAFVLPLFKKVLGLHEAGLVAPFEREESLFVTAGILDIDDALAHAPSNALYRGEMRFPAGSGGPGGRDGLDGHDGLDGREGSGGHDELDLHHDPQTDLFCLGLILGSVAMGLDLYNKEDLRLFSLHRSNPSYHYPRIHPTLGRLITEMTEPDRSRRSQDLYEVIGLLDHYRDFDAESQTDLSAIPGWMQKELKQRDAFILNKLRNRLFDTSRRNRLLYYKPNARLVNLTVASVPLVLYDRSIRPEWLFTWGGELAEKITGMKEILLNKYLRFQDHLYLASSLDTVRLTAQRDIQEYGFSQLKLVIAFLSWHNLKEEPAERIRTPLLLLPAGLKKIKKLKEDHYVLTTNDNAAEVNPVLAGLLKELYGIRLPDFIDLEEMSPGQFYSHVQTQIEGANQGIALRYLYQPDISLLSEQAQQTIRQYGKKQSRNRPVLYTDVKEFLRDPGLRIGGIHSGVWPIPWRLLADPLNRETAGIKPAEGDNDPHRWDFDTCHMVLGNFHYKKMSLVRDYNLVIDQQMQHHVFDELFGDQPKTFPDHAFDGNRPDDWYHVIAADPSQTRAILQGRAGYSYIIQGPPGTGKSQTITNLIADFLARGASILFVCEKRAALDVVYHRLKQIGLEELCCYIHDSQRDKRDFVKNLKATYEDFTQQKPDLAALKVRRQSLLDKMNGQLDFIRGFHDTSNSEGPDTGASVRLLIERLLILREELPRLSPAEEEILSTYREWRESAPALEKLSVFLDDTGAGPVFSASPFSRVREELFFTTTPYRALSEALLQALAALEKVRSRLADIAIDPALGQDRNRLNNLVRFAELLYPLAINGLLALADPGGEEAKELDRRLQHYRQLQEAHREACGKNGRWAPKLEEGDLDQALSLAIRYEKSFFGALKGSWRKLKLQVNERYDFSGLAVRPSYTHLLELLKAEYAAAARVVEYQQELRVLYRLDSNIDSYLRGIGLLQSKKGHPELDYLLRHPDGVSLITALPDLHEPLSRLESSLHQCLQEQPAGNFAELQDELQTLRLNAEALGEWLPALRVFSGLLPAVKRALRQLPYRIPQLEAATARKALQDLYQSNRSFSTIDYQALDRAAQQLGEGYIALQKINADIIRAFVRQRFLQRLDLSNRAASQLSEDQKKFKKTYAEGRKILENEFGKSMRYKSIREISEKESGTVLKDIKPVWLMSPYSVSDSLPLDYDHFDVVIFDEASQITLEEGVPALYRSRQAIIVGDEKQMPPSDFFSTGSKENDPDDLDKMDEGPADEWLSNDADSLLAQGARKLVSTLLNWHYRSQYETLISYSNHAFYEGNLLTIPDKAIHHREKAPICITDPEQAVLHADALFDRSVSFHLLTGSVYEKRSNAAEAGYIARLVRELLNRGTRESIGIVAFSQEQQQVIGDALDELAAEDPGFAQCLEEAFNRTENDQFVGLIIKNLENIQGDERDIIIMSVCYGFDSRRRMLMNFGPVNKRGGEKRLNVLFSRARMHMAVV
ncbi:MAG TPA: AAA domain-containing protein, partial [Puia sp.]|nr:AAA domain-containing protein [Puia sp.]